eukprot:8888728-Lingulodinium_polyedra.AAC.1
MEIDQPGGQGGTLGPANGTVDGHGTRLAGGAVPPVQSSDGRTAQGDARSSGIRQTKGATHTTSAGSAGGSALQR